MLGLDNVLYQIILHLCSPMVTPPPYAEESFFQVSYAQSARGISDERTR